ncbi:MAG: alpha/beta hydrolase [Chloroflexi bacterium]|nr:alpha/beta hydrolase [Chloroflexota bacterium]
MCETIDYSIFDRPEILRIAFYPRAEYSEGPFNAMDLVAPVGEGVSITCRLYVKGRASPAILFFHGNGEVVSQYDEIAPLFNNIGVNLIVADYRGYGASGGSPSFASMIADAEATYQHVLGRMQQERFTGGLFVMGRSLGSLSALELACQHQDDLSGLIVESGFASPSRLLTHIAGGADRPGFQEADALAARNLKAIKMPALIIHGEYDDLIPLYEGQYIFDNLGSADKHLFVVLGAGHNDVMFRDVRLYFETLGQFVAGA